MTNKLIRQLFYPTLFPTDFFDQFESVFRHMESWDPKTNVLRFQKGFPKGGILTDKDGNIVIELSLAGYSKEQLSVTVGDNKITVSATKCDDAEDKEASTLARRAFTKEFTNLDREFDLERTKVSYKDGLLRIVVPRKESEEPKVKEIEIK